MMAKYWYISFVVGISAGLILNYVPGVSGAGRAIIFCLGLIIAFSVTAIIKELKEIEEILKEKRRQ